MDTAGQGVAELQTRAQLRQRHRKAINLFNTARGIVVEDAPIRGQCARPYLYAKQSDLGLEKLLQEYEGPYAEAVKRLDESGLLDEPGVAALGLFMFIQQVRTEGAIRQRRQAFEMMHSAASEGILGEKMEAVAYRTDHQLAREQIRDSIFHVQYMSDLRYCAVVNETEVDFVTSDDPAVFTNRWMLQRWKKNDFGLANTGALWFMPLSPRKLFLGYDTQAYMTPERQGNLLSITKPEDAAALNEFQYLKAQSNIYFADPSKASEVVAAFNQVKARRRDDWFKVHVMVPAGAGSTSVHAVRGSTNERYRMASGAERQSAREKAALAAEDQSRTKPMGVRAPVPQPCQVLRQRLRSGAGAT
jgi:hypothetical protein